MINSDYDIINLKNPLTSLAAYQPLQFEVLLKQNIKNGISIGQDFKNMAEKYEINLGSSKTEQNKFLNKISINEYKKSYLIVTPDNNGIYFFDADKKQNKIKDNIIKSSFVCTTEKNILLLSKPADCPTAIIYSTTQSNIPIVGVMHSGRRETEGLAPKKIIDFLVNTHKIILDKTLICLAPSIGPKNYYIKLEDIKTFKNPKAKLTLDLKSWENYSYKTGLKNKKLLHLDIKKYILDQFISSGINPKNIYNYNLDTFDLASKSLAFSHRYSKIEEKTEGRFVVAAMLSTT